MVYEMLSLSKLMGLVSVSLMVIWFRHGTVINAVGFGCLSDSECSVL